MANRLTGKVVLVSGGARGLGASHVELFASEGAAVAFGDVRTNEGEALDSELAARGLDVRFVPLDVTSPASWEAAVQRVLAEHGRVTTLVNNAAIFDSSGTADLTPDAWQRVLQVNLEGQWLGMRAVLPAMTGASASGAAIVNISSVYGHMATPDAIAYHASKGGVRALTQSVALEYASKGIRVNAVSPGMIDTLFAGPSTPRDAETESMVVPMRRKAHPREIAYASLFLASDEASYVTGSELVVDGGWSAG